MYILLKCMNIDYDYEQIDRENILLSIDTPPKMYFSTRPPFNTDNW